MQNKAERENYYEQGSPQRSPMPTVLARLLSSKESNKAVNAKEAEPARVSSVESRPSQSSFLLRNCE